MCLKSADKLTKKEIRVLILVHGYVILVTNITKSFSYGIKNGLKKLKARLLLLSNLMFKYKDCVGWDY